MSLSLYQTRSCVPSSIEYVKNNRAYFVEKTIRVLDHRVDGLLKNTDGAVYFDQYRFIDKYGVGVPWINLSTGGMTVLNVFYNPDVCFDTLECGENALTDLKNLHEGNIVGLRVYAVDGNNSCDILLDGDCEAHITDVGEFD